MWIITHWIWKLCFQGVEKIPDEMPENMWNGVIASSILLNGSLNFKTM